MSFEAYLETIKAKTGLGPEEMRSLADAKGFSDQGKLKSDVRSARIVEWLRTDYDLGHGHAMAVYALLTGKRKPGG